MNTFVAFLPRHQCAPPSASRWRQSPHESLPSSELRMKLTQLTLALAVLTVAACSHPSPMASAKASPASGVAPGDWPTFNRTLAGDRFSPLAEIDRSN